MASPDLKNPATQKIILAGMLGGAMIGVFFFSHLLPVTYPVQQEKINQLKADYERRSTELARARTMVADLPRFEAEYEQLHNQWSLAAELLPTDPDLPALLRKITLAGEQTGVTFVLFKPGNARTEQYYTEMPVSISVQGGYHQVGSFMAELANLRRIVTVSSVRLHASTTQDPLLTTAAEFTASAYSLNTTPVPAAASAASTASTAGGAKAKNVKDAKGGSSARKSS